MGHAAVMAGAFEGCFDGLVLLHQRHGVLKVTIPDLTVGEDAFPENALDVIAAPEAENDRQGDLAFAEIVADGLAEPIGVACVVECVVNELEGDTEIFAVGAQCCLFFGRAGGDGGADFGGGRE